MNVLITGGAGFIGSHLTSYYLEQGHSVCVIDNLKTGQYANLSKHLTNPCFQFIKEDIVTFADWQTLLASVDLVFHMAAMVGVFNVLHHPLEVLSVGIDGSKNILEAANQLKKKPRIIMASSSEIYGATHPPPLSERAPLFVSDLNSHRATYAISKISMESYTAQYDLPVTTIRLFNTIGTGQSTNYGMVVPRFIEQALRHEPITIFGTGEQKRCFMDVRDATVLLDKIAACKSLEGETVNLGQAQEISIMELALLVKKMTNSASEIKTISYKEAYGEAFEDFKVRTPCLNKLKQHIELSYAWDLEKTLQHLIQTMQKEKC